MNKLEIKKINGGLASLLLEIQHRIPSKLAADTLFKSTQEFVRRPGKRIRPILFLLAYRGYTRRLKLDEKKLYGASAAIELLHDFMLIHDDVIDCSDLRRGKPTLHRLFDAQFKTITKEKIGPKLAIVAGDILFAVAIEALLNVDEPPERKEKALRQLVTAASYTGAGEFLDVVLSYQPIELLSKKDIFLNYTLKTAHYTFECPLVMGALLAGADDSEIKNLSLAGLAAGQAFQLYDDFLDLFSQEKAIGKPVLADIAESKKTLLVLKAYQNLRNREKELFKKILDKKNKKRADLETFRRLIVASGAFEDCQTTLSHLQQKALKKISGLHIKTPQKLILENLVTNLSTSPKTLTLSS